jgi:predicted transglutaminase-like cysteine proteinase
MKRGLALAAAMWGIMACAAVAQGPLISQNSVSKSASATEYGASLPPIGYIRYCAENKSDCGKAAASSETDGFSLTADRWKMLFRTNTYVNNKISPVSDQDQYGEIERWTVPVDKGDCEDYVLLKQKYLKNLGFPSSALLITVVLDENNEGHAILTVKTKEGDFVLDNRRNDILRWSESGYSFLKRQSQANPKHWVALEQRQVSATAVISSSAGEE